ncbi:MAG TPA: class I fructose-bisphosphate aldolase [Elusimicrobiota bacterium]|nr:class I fructose-bisphosphate aldolase [Elusimicrobiota bacterium]
MTAADLEQTARALVADAKGLLAMDESNPTCNKRFERLRIPQTVEMRRAYRELLLTAPGLGGSISGVILYDETIRQATKNGTSFLRVIEDSGMIIGIKVDLGAKDMAGFPGEKITEGLDGLRERLHDYARLGARFAKWRAVISIGPGLPTSRCVASNAEALARYAALCQECGLVPIVEPEVLMDGDHGLARCAEVTENALRTLFAALSAHRVALEGLLLKPNMVLPGKDSKVQDGVDAVAQATVRTLLRTVPAAVPGVAFLSGGQAPQLACERLSAMNSAFSGRLPWALTFSFSRALQEPVLADWKGKDSGVEAAQTALLHRARCASAARRGRYSADSEAAAG